MPYKNKEDLYKAQSNHRLDNKRRAWEYLLNHPCVDCGESDPVVLEFDHLSDKKGNVGSWINASTRSWKLILSEIKKCEVRCANCHRRKTHAQFNHGDYSIIDG